jgi:hypothetical protein
MSKQTQEEVFRLENEIANRDFKLQELLLEENELLEREANFPSL